MHCLCCRLLQLRPGSYSIKHLQGMPSWLLQPCRGVHLHPLLVWPLLKLPWISDLHGSQRRVQDRAKHADVDARVQCWRRGVCNEQPSTADHAGIHIADAVQRRVVQHWECRGVHCMPCWNLFLRNPCNELVHLPGVPCRILLHAARIQLLPRLWCRLLQHVYWTEQQRRVPGLSHGHVFLCPGRQLLHQLRRWEVEQPYRPGVQRAVLVVPSWHLLGCTHTDKHARLYQVQCRNLLFTAGGCLLVHVRALPSRHLLHPGRPHGRRHVHKVRRRNVLDCDWGQLDQHVPELPHWHVLAGAWCDQLIHVRRLWHGHIFQCSRFYGVHAVRQGYLLVADGSDKQRRLHIMPCW